MRNICSLNEGWQFFKAANLQDLTGSKGDPVALPHTWSTTADSHRGVCWYVRDLPMPDMSGGKQFLQV